MNKIVGLALLLSILAIIFLYQRLNTNDVNTASPPTSQAIIQEQNDDCIPTFTDGGGPYYQPNSPFKNKLSPEDHNGETLIVSGKLLANDCQTPIPNAVIDLWQANETGNYEDIWYRGQIRTDTDGNYSFETVVPRGYGEGTGYRPPHIHFKVFVNKIEIITSQMFFPETRGRLGFDDAYIMSVETKDVNGTRKHSGYHNIILP